MLVTIPKGTPQKAVQKALGELEKYRGGQIRPKRLNCSGRKTEVIKVGLYYRLVRSGLGKWALMTHEAYNNVHRRLHR